MIWLILGPALLLGGCAAPGFRAEVTRFHALDPPGGESIRIVPGEGIEQGLEFENYAAQLGRYFINYGYLPAGDKPPIIIAYLGYDAKPDPNFSASTGPVVGIGFGGYGGHVGGSMSTSIDTSNEDRLYYRHTIRLVMVDAGTGKQIFEGSAFGYERGEYWPAMMPRLLQALFTDWPGQSGKTVKVKLPDQ
jgi:hypothetical protein